MKPAGNWDEKKPDMGERLATGLSVHSSLAETLGGLPVMTASDFAAAVGLVPNTVHKLILGARYGDWPTAQDQVREITLRYNWTRWIERKRKGSMSVSLNARMVDLALIEWCSRPDQRHKVSHAYRAKLLQVGYRRYKSEVQDHYTELVGWLDAETTNAMRSLKQQIRGAWG